MPQYFVKIVNRDGKYTNERKAHLYVARGFAAIVKATESGRLLEIRMLEAAEIALVQSGLKSSRRAIDNIEGVFEPFVGDSGGSQLMKHYEGTTGGHRVWQLDHKIPKEQDAGSATEAMS